MFQRLGFLVLAVSFMTGCYGRIHDGDAGRKIDAKTYGLDGTRPALLVFSAVWCKPCMAEIPALNRANRDLSSKLQIASFLVEGSQKGVAAAPKDTDLALSPAGDKPEYKLTADPSWSLFDAIKPDGGRALPTMVFVSVDQTVVRIVQRSMDYDSELLPALKLLISGQKPVEPAKPAEPIGVRGTITMPEWIAQAGHDSTSLIYSNVFQAWTRGLSDFNFFEEDMPFEDSKVSVITFADGSTVLEKAVWVASMTGCKLTVFFLPDGAYERSEGICR